jgi:spectinomycin phosphotransferase
MREKPSVPDEQIIACLQKEFEISVIDLKFFLSGDVNTAAYDVIAADGTNYFLKLRKEFDPILVTVPLFLKSQGIEAIIVPLETKSKRYWADFDEYKIILYPFVAGKTGFDMELSDQHKRDFGVALKAIHSVQVPPQLERLIPRESFSTEWRNSIRSFQVQAETISFQDPTAVKLAAFIKSKKDVISRLVERAEQLGATLRSQPLEYVLCHSDVHGRNILITEKAQLFIVDWDNPILAPKERDLMFVGGGIDPIWRNERDIAMFYEGYGDTEVNQSALAYYRYERVIQDLVELGRLLLLTGDGADREQLYKYFSSNIEPGTRIEIAKKTDPLFTNGSLI